MLPPGRHGVAPQVLLLHGQPHRMPHGLWAEVEDDLHQVVGRVVQQRVRLGGLLGREHMGDQRQRVQPAAGAQLHHGGVQALPGPPAAQHRRHRADLGRHQADPVVVELLAEPERSGRPLVEAGGDHGAVDPGTADRLVQRGVDPGQLDHPVGAAAVGLLPHVERDVTVDQHRDGPELLRPLQPRRQGVDGDHLDALARQQLGGEQADHALTEDHHRLAEEGSGREHGVQGNRADPVEGADHRVEAGREPVPVQPLDRDDGVGPMPPHPPDHVVRREAGHVGPDRLHPTDLGVAPDVHRVGERRFPGEEQRHLGVPAPVQVGVGAPVGGQLGAGRDAGVPGADQHFAGSGGGGVVRADPDRARLGQLNEICHCGGRSALLLLGSKPE